MTVFSLVLHPPAPKTRPTIGEIGTTLHCSYWLARAIRKSDDPKWIYQKIAQYGDHLEPHQRSTLFNKIK